MATLVGTQTELTRLLHELCELDFDAAAAYEAAIERMEDPNDRSNLRSFLADHIRHTVELRTLLDGMGKVGPTRAHATSILTRGKVILGGLFGPRAILFAMRMNENDTNVAYERALARQDLPDYVRGVLERNFSDERRHRAWVESRLRSFKREAPNGARLYG